MSEPTVEQKPPESSAPITRKVYVTAVISQSLGCLAWVFIPVFFIVGSFPHSKLNINSLMNAMFCVAIFIFLLAFLAFFFGIIARIVLLRVPGPTTAIKRKAYGGIILGISLIFVVTLFMDSHRPHKAIPPACENNLNGNGLVLEIFANESKGKIYPAIPPEPGKLSLLNASNTYPTPLYPTYFHDLASLYCPLTQEWKNYHPIEKEPDPQRIFDSSSYYYLGYLITSDEDMETFAEVYKEQLATGVPSFTQDFKVPAGKGNRGTDTIYRLRQGIERFMVIDINNPSAGDKAQCLIPVMIEKLGHHVPNGGHVLYLDGHVTYLKYPGEWPMTEKTVGILKSLEALRQP